MLAQWFPRIRTVARPESALTPADDALFDEALRLLRQPLSSDFVLPNAWAASVLAAPADVFETPEAVEVHVDLPGYDPNAIEVQLSGDTLHIRAERRQAVDQNTAFIRSERPFGSMARSFALPKSVDGANCDASYAHGVLTVKIPKREEAKPRNVQVKVHS